MSLKCMLLQDMEDLAFLPTTNLAETKHASWLAGEGNKDMLSLYDACVSDLANALLQGVKMLASVEGRYHGAGPSAEKLARRAEQGRAPQPAVIAREVDQHLGGTPLYQWPFVDGNNVTVSKKRKQTGNVSMEEENSSHRPEYLTQNVPRDQRGQRGTCGLPSQTEYEFHEEMFPEETEIHKTMWAIRRIPKGSRVQCHGWLGAQAGKCKKNIKNSGMGSAAPSFWGVRTWDSGTDNTHGRGSKAQFMWFCNDNVDHTWHICNNITQCPPRIPSVWPIEKGTNLTPSELKTLEDAGYIIKKCAVKEKNATRYRSGISIPASKRIESAISMEAQIEEHSVIKANMHEKFCVRTATSQVRGEVYEIHIASNPMCTCGDFTSRTAEGKPYMACKHIYFLFLRYFGLDVNHSMFIHQSKLTSEDLLRVFSSRRTM